MMGRWIGEGCLGRVFYNTSGSIAQNVISLALLGERVQLGTYAGKISNAPENRFVRVLGHLGQVLHWDIWEPQDPSVVRRLLVDMKD
jgi:hypothetical protein